MQEVVPFRLDAARALALKVKVVVLADEVRQLVGECVRDFAMVTQESQN